jgi:hypothetical protein
MKIKSLIITLTLVFACACTFPGMAQTSATTLPLTATPAVATETLPSTATFTATYTSTSTATFTLTSTPTPTPSPTITFTPTVTSTPTITPTPTFAFPSVTVNLALAACLYGPASSYMWARDLKAGDTGFVWGRAPVGSWLYVKMDNLDIPCWVSPYVVDVQGDVSTVLVTQPWLPITNALYGPPQNVRAERKGDQVTVTWDDVYMTEDDDRGYFLDVWVCQNGNYVWMPIGRTELPNQYHTAYTFTDQPGCSQPSGGKLYTAEKHGYTDPVDIPWPPYDD